MNSTEYRLDKLSELYSSGEISLTQLEDLTVQALNGEQPTLGGIPVIPDPDLISIGSEWR